jgi:hypothetical protein
MLRNKLKYAYNFISLTGLVLAVTGAGLITVFLAMELITGVTNPYTGLLVYFAFPGMLVVGLLLIPIGILRERNRKTVAERLDLPPYPVLDLNESHNRHMLVFFIVATVVFLLIITVAAIKGYEYTESAAFCGKLCHTVMEPEYTAWSNSPHARVRCAECHIGPGAEWFVKTKLSGLRQVYKVLTHTYPTPIETPGPKNSTPEDIRLFIISFPMKIIRCVKSVFCSKQAGAPSCPMPKGFTGISGRRCTIRTGM